MFMMIKGLTCVIFLHSFGTYFTEDDYINKTQDRFFNTLDI